MENSKLMHILVRDICEVEQLAEEIRQNQGYDAMDIELLITRIGGIRHLLEVAAGIKGQAREVTGKMIVPSGEKNPAPVSADFHAVHSEPDVKESKNEKFPKQTELTHLISGSKTLSRAAQDSPSEDFKIPEVKASVLKSDHDTGLRETGRDIRQKVETGTVISGTALTEEPGKGINTEVTPLYPGLEEEHTSPPEKQILGEKFVAGKSLNDLLFEKGFSDSKYDTLPVSSLASAIRTNDRFLFSRELFDGNMDTFNDAIRKIDDMHSIQEAASYLHDNFKWKKSETSLKFIELVKRRFLS